MPLQTTIKVIGVGGAGGNAIDRMMGSSIRGIELVAVNTDAQDLRKIRAHRKLQIGKEITQGLGAGMNPEVGRLAAEENKEDLAELVRGTDMIFIAAGLGGGTGGGVAPAIAEIAKAQKILTIAVVTKPFSFEGAWRARSAEKALEELRANVDTLLVISNDQIVKLSDAETTVVSAFWKADEVLRQAVQGISDLIVMPGLINVDFADLKSIMSHSGHAVFGMGQAKGENRIAAAVDMALHSPLLNMSIKGAKGVLFNIAGSDDLTLAEVRDAARKIGNELSPGAKIIFGAVHDKGIKDGEIKLTVIATDFEEKPARQAVPA